MSLTKKKKAWLLKFQVFTPWRVWEMEPSCAGRSQRQAAESLGYCSPGAKVFREKKWMWNVARNPSWKSARSCAESPRGAAWRWFLHQQGCWDNHLPTQGLLTRGWVLSEKLHNGLYQLAIGKLGDDFSLSLLLVSTPEDMLDAGKRELGSSRPQTVPLLQACRALNLNPVILNGFPPYFF